MSAPFSDWRWDMYAHNTGAAVAGIGGVVTGCELRNHLQPSL